MMRRRRRREPEGKDEEKDDDDDNYNSKSKSKQKKRRRRGDRVEAKVKGWTKYYGGEITRVNDDGTYDIKFDDGERKKNVKDSNIKGGQDDDDDDDDDKIVIDRKIKDLVAVVAAANLIIKEIV